MRINPKLKKYPKEWLADKTAIKEAMETAERFAKRYKELFATSKNPASQKVED